MHFIELIARVLSLDCDFAKIKNDIMRLLDGSKTEYEIGTLKNHMSDEMWDYYQEEVISVGEIDVEKEQAELDKKYSNDFFRKRGEK